MNLIIKICLFSFFVASKAPLPNPPLIRTTLGQLFSALLDSWSRPVVIQPGIEPGSVVTPLALRCSALDRCATREAPDRNILFARVFLQDMTTELFYLQHLTSDRDMCLFNLLWLNALIVSRYRSYSSWLVFLLDVHFSFLMYLVWCPLWLAVCSIVLYIQCSLYFCPVSIQC